jgi:hypothetical protein
MPLYCMPQCLDTVLGHILVNVIMSSIAVMKVIMPSVIMMNVITLSVIMMNVIMQIVIAPISTVGGFHLIKLHVGHSGQN